MINVVRTDDASKCILDVKGKIDSSNAAEFEQKIFELSNDSNEVILDLKDLEYITSAGLRGVLKLKKAKGNLEAINLNSAIYEIFEMTGFSEVITVHRKRRQLSCEGCEEIARGAIGVIYRLDADTILKVYDNTIPLETLYQGQEVLKKLFINDVPCAIPFDIVDVGESHGAVYEMLDAVTLSQYMTNHPDEIESVAAKNAKLLKTQHSNPLPDGILPSVKDVMGGWLVELEDVLPKEDLDRCREIIEGFSDAKSFLHMDYHPKNQMIKDGEIIIIDLDDACVGDPMADIGSMLMTMRKLDWGEERVRKTLGITTEQKDRYAKAFFETYFEMQGEELQAKLDSLLPIARIRSLYARLHLIMPEDQKKALIAAMVKEIHESFSNK